MAWCLMRMTRTLTGTPTTVSEEVTYTYTVTDEDGDSATLTFTITVLEKTLDDLTVSEGVLEPAFETETTTYTVTVGNAVEDLTLTALAGIATKIIINGVPVTSGTPSEAIPLNVGDNIIEVIAVDQTYIVTVTREANSAPPAPVLQDQTAAAQTAFHYAFPEVADSDSGQTVTYNATLEGGGALPAWLRFDAISCTFSGTPARVDMGTVIIAVMAMDDGTPPRATRAAFTLTVEAPSTEPQVLKSALASFGRTVASDAVAVMENRIIRPVPDSIRVILGGHDLDQRLHGSRVFGLLYSVARVAGLEVHLPVYPGQFDGGMSYMSLEGYKQLAEAAHDHTPVRFSRRATRDILSQSNFDLKLGSEKRTSAWSLWGQGNTRMFSGQPGNVSVDGRVLSGYLGIDYRVKNPLKLGLALSRNAGELDYTSTLGDAGVVDMTLTSVLPYMHWSARTGMDVWGMGGAGWGAMQVTDQYRDAETDISMMMGAVGIYNALARLGEMGLALKGDGFMTRLKSDERETLPQTEAEAQRVRFMLEGQLDHLISEKGMFTFLVDIGGRWDGGSAETGLGLEQGGSLSYLNTARGWSIEAIGRHLLAHQQADFEEWGASLAFRIDPGMHGRGLQVTMTPSWGNSVSRTDAMWDNNGVIDTAFFGGGSGDGVALAAAAL